LPTWSAEIEEEIPVKVKALAATTMAALTLAVPFAATAHAADGQCQYGQRTDGTCWDAQANPQTTITITITITIH
jgi:hypothetical protein